MGSFGAIIIILFNNLFEIKLYGVLSSKRYDTRCVFNLSNLFFRRLFSGFFCATVFYEF